MIMRLVAASVTAVLLAAAPVFAQSGTSRADAAKLPALRAAELAIETDSRALRLPTGGVGALSIADCVPCARQSLIVGTGTRFQVRNEDVTLAAFLQQTRGVRALPVVVFYRPGTNDVTRIRVSAPPIATGRVGASRSGS